MLVLWLRRERSKTTLTVTQETEIDGKILTSKKKGKKRPSGKTFTLEDDKKIDVVLGDMI